MYSGNLWVIRAVWDVCVFNCACEFRVCWVCPVWLCVFVQEAKWGHMACEPYMRIEWEGGGSASGDGKAVKPFASLVKASEWANEIDVLYLHTLRFSFMADKSHLHVNYGRSDFYKLKMELYCTYQIYRHFTVKLSAAIRILKPQRTKHKMDQLLYIWEWMIRGGRWTHDSTSSHKNLHDAGSLLRVSDQYSKWSREKEMTFFKNTF